MSVVAECQNAAEVVDFIRKDQCDVMVLDIDMPGKSGLDLMKELKARELGSKFLMLNFKSNLLINLPIFRHRVATKWVSYLIGDPYYPGVPIFALFLNRLFPQDIHKTVVYLMLVVGLFFPASTV